MTEVVTTLEEAMHWFMSHSSSSVTCEKSDGTQQECFSYPEAKKFYGA